MEINNWVLAGRLPDELWQYREKPTDEIPPKALTKLKQADIMMQYHQQNPDIIKMLLADKKWRTITVRTVGESEMVEMVLS